MTQYRLAASKFVQVLERDAQGRPTKILRLSRGDVIDVAGSEENRLLAAGALASLNPDDVPADDTDQDAATTASESGRPRNTSAKKAWVDYAVTSVPTDS